MIECRRRRRGAAGRRSSGSAEGRFGGGTCARCREVYWRQTRRTGRGKARDGPVRIDDCGSAGLRGPPLGRRGVRPCASPLGGGRSAAMCARDVVTACVLMQAEEHRWEPWVLPAHSCCRPKRGEIDARCSQPPGQPWAERERVGALAKALQAKPSRAAFLGHAAPLCSRWTDRARLASLPPAGRMRRSSWSDEKPSPWRLVP